MVSVNKLGCVRCSCPHGTDTLNSTPAFGETKLVDVHQLQGYTTGRTRQQTLPMTTLEVQLGHLGIGTPIAACWLVP